MKNKKSPNLINVFRLKEIKFWKRTWTMHKKFNMFGKLTIFPISLSIIGIFHYAFAGMHFLFEIFLWLAVRSQFKANMLTLQREALS